MAYTDINFKTKKQLKEAVAANRRVTYYQPNDMSGHGARQDGIIYIEGPHYPAPHTWYAQCEAVNGVITKVK